MAALDTNISDITFTPKPTIHNFVDIEGQVFGCLTVLGFAGRVNGRKPVQWWCKCECGNLTRVGGICLRSGQTQSCGCLRTTQMRRLTRRHGKTGTPEHKIWGGMRNRCNNPRNHKFPHYGQRGIRVCNRWNDFENFLADMGKRPTPKHSIERINNDGNYDPDNCKWAEPKEQMNNQHKTLMIEYQGRCQSLSVWCSELGIPRYRTYKRIYVSGWSVEKAFTEPKHKNKYI